MKRGISLIFIGIAVLLLTSCNTSTKTLIEEYDNTGTVLIKKTETKTSESAEVMHSMAPAIAACEVSLENRRQLAIKSIGGVSPVPQLSNEQILSLKADAQKAYIDKSFTHGLVVTMSDQTRMIIAAFKKTPMTCAQAVAIAIDSYMEKEEVQAKQWGSTGLALAIAVPVAWIANSALKIIDTAVASSGDININELNANANGGGSKGEGSSGDGGNIDIILGKGNSSNKLDNGSILQQAEKQLINPVTDGGGTNTLDDSGDGSGNQAGINPFGQ